jgi:hypothetical protein
MPHQLVVVVGNDDLEDFLILCEQSLRLLEFMLVFILVAAMHMPPKWHQFLLLQIT